MKDCRKKIVYSTAYTTFVHSLLLIQLLSTRNPILPKFEQEFKYLHAVYVTLGPYYLYKNLLIRSFVFSEINIFGVPKIIKISLAFNIFVPISVHKRVYLKAI